MRCRTASPRTCVTATPSASSGYRECDIHRVFRSSVPPPPAIDALDELRAFLRSLGLIEQAAGDSLLYLYVHAGSVRQFATLHGERRSATIYLYPDALGRAAGVATAFYRVLDDAGLGMGSKAGPSIGIDFDHPAQLRLFREGLTAVFAED